MDYLRKRFPEQERKTLLLCMVSTFIFGLAAHAYGLLNNIFSHDSLNALYADANENLTKVAIGRFLVPAIRALRGPVALPWLIGIISFVFIGCSTYLIVKTFDVSSKPAMVLIAGVMVTNTTVTAIAATYVHEFDLDMLALLLSCMAAYIWKKSTKIKELIPAALLLIASMAIYQSYIEVTVTLMIMCLLIDAIDGKKVKDIFFKGVKGFSVSAVSAVIYYLLNKLICTLTDAEVISRVDITLEYKVSFIQRLRACFVDIGAAFATPSSVYNLLLIAGLNCCMLAGIGICILVMWKKNKVSAGGIVITVLLMAMLPFGMDFIALLSHEEVHDVMKFSYWMFYVFAAVLLFRYAPQIKSNKSRSAVRIISVVIAAVLIWNNILVANTAHLKKVLEHDVTLVTLERVIEDLEARDDYVIGETEIAFSGYPDIQEMYPGFERITRMTGAKFTMSIGVVNYTDYYNSYRSYFRYYFNYPMVISNTDYSSDERVKAMPSFPEEGYIQRIDGKLIVNFGEKKLSFLKKTNLALDIMKTKEFFSRIINKNGEK